MALSISGLWVVTPVPFHQRGQGHIWFKWLVTRKVGTTANRGTFSFVLKVTNGKALT